MIDPQTIAVAVAACVLVVAVWAWGIVREDAAVVRAHASGIEAGRALERSAARGAIVAGTTTGDGAAKIDAMGPSLAQDAPNGPAMPNDLSRPEMGDSARSERREIPAWLRTPGGGSGEGD